MNCSKINDIFMLHSSYVLFEFFKKYYFYLAVKNHLHLSNVYVGFYLLKFIVVVFVRGSYSKNSLFNASINLRCGLVQKWVVILSPTQQQGNLKDMENDGLRQNSGQRVKSKLQIPLFILLCCHLFNLHHSPV